MTGKLDSVRDRGKLDSVRNAARLLKQFNYREQELGVSELARRLGLGKSTAHRLVATLAAEQLLEQNRETGKYRLGLAIYDLGASVSAHFALHEAALPSMAQLRNATGETVQLAVLDGREVVYIDRLEGPASVRMFLEIGRRNWAHCTATGKVLLAYVPDDRLERLLAGWELTRKTPYTITDHRLLREELLKVRRRGWADNRYESEINHLSVGAPVRNAMGDVVAAMSVAGPAKRMDPALDRVTMELLEAAAAGSRRMGYRMAAP